MGSREIRAIVASKYPGPGWKRRVDRMPDRQVYAIYKTMQDRERKEAQKAKNSEGEYQMTIWDLL